MWSGNPPDKRLKVGTHLVRILRPFSSSRHRTTMQPKIDGIDGRWFPCPAGCGAEYRNEDAAALCGFFHR